MPKWARVTVLVQIWTSGWMNWIPIFLGSIHMVNKSLKPTKAASILDNQGGCAWPNKSRGFCCICCRLYCIILYWPVLIHSSKGNVWNFISNLFGMPHRLLKLIWSKIRSKKSHYQAGRNSHLYSFLICFLLSILGNYLHFWICFYLFAGKISLGKFLFYYFNCKLINS